MFKNMEKNGLVTGVALGLTATALMPILKNTLVNLSIIGVRGAVCLVDRTKTTLKLAKEEMEDIIAEAQFERMKNQLDNELCQMPEIENNQLS